MKSFPLIAFFSCCVFFSNAQLTVTATAANPNICLGNSTTLTATATPVGYTMTSIAYNADALQGVNMLADNGVAATTLTVGNLDDGRWDNIALPFTFTFYGNTFNSINVSTNGWVGLGSTNSVTTGFGFSLPNASAPNNVIHAMTCDLNFKPATTSTIEYFTNGFPPNQRFTVSFNSIKFFSGGGTGDVQVMFYEGTNVIEIHTGDCTNTTLAKAQGIENSTGTVGTAVTGRNNTTNWSGTGMPNAYRFTPDNITFSWSPATGLNTTNGYSVIASPTTSTTYTVNATNTGNGNTGSQTVAVNIDPASFVLAATPGGAQICQNISVSGSGTYYRDGNCNLISKITPAGVNPVSNSINTCIKLDTGATKRGTTDLFLARQYDIEPLILASTSTASVILYYKQSEFNNYNLKAADSGQKLFPTGPGDATGISNVVVKQYHGTGTNPLNYTGGSQSLYAPLTGFSVVWNATNSIWEITVPVSGFSGFYLTTKKSGALAIDLDYFKGVQVNRQNQLNWKVYCSSPLARFELERSSDGLQYNSITSITADQLRCSQPFEYTDENPFAGTNYYRLRIVDIDGKPSYSSIVLLNVKTQPFELVSLNPNIVPGENTTLKANATEKTDLLLVISDFSGRRLRSRTVSLVTGSNLVPISTAGLATGAYLLTGYAKGEKNQTLRFIKP